MEDQFGSDFISITDADGVEYELEVLATLEYNGATYLATIPASDEMNPEIIIFKSVEEDGSPILYTVDDEQEAETVNMLIMESLYQDCEEV